MRCFHRYVLIPELPHSHSLSTSTPQFQPQRDSISTTSYNVHLVDVSHVLLPVRLDVEAIELFWLTDLHTHCGSYTRGRFLLNTVPRRFVSQSMSTNTLSALEHPCRHLSFNSTVRPRSPSRTRIAARHPRCERSNPHVCRTHPSTPICTTRLPHVPLSTPPHPNHYCGRTSTPERRTILPPAQRASKQCSRRSVR
ncbi:hypothetical protein C8Q70DRAFT_420706 [Cubamyces menziesii]|nr:hypothetical protein C8Q70DRAFT_420706 [Cubamyces menziesii]